LSKQRKRLLRSSPNRLLKQQLPNQSAESKEAI
jgi:hypothetical protein